MKNNFYEQLEEISNKLSKQDMQIMLEDFNAKVGKELVDRTTIGKHSVHDVSYNK